MKRNQGESYLSYVKRLTAGLDNHTLSYEGWIQDLLEDSKPMFGEENSRRISVFFRRFLSKLDEEQAADYCTEDELAELKAAKEDLAKERKKLQTANLEYNANARIEARNEMFQQQIVDAIGRLEPLTVKHIVTTPEVSTSGLLCLSDFHAGSTYEIKGMYDEIVNKYDYDTMCNRLWYLLAQMEADDVVYDDLTIALMGDFFENVLRISSLTKLKEPVVDTVLKFSEFICTWITEVHNRLGVPINVVTVGGNHDVQRLLGSKPMLEDENLAKIVVGFMKLRLAGIDGVTVDDYTDCAIKTIRKTNVMFQHGEGDVTTTMDYFSNLYGVDVDEGYFGHLHRQESKSAGIADVGDRMCYRVGSICGMDGFAKKLRKASRASATFVTYTDNGRAWSKTYYLN